jgi:hypothetical protein
VIPELNFQIEGAEAVPFSMAPLLAFKLRVTNVDPEQVVHSVALRCQIQIEAPKRTYNADEQERLLDLFGEAQRWTQTLRSMLWTHASIVVPPFTGSTIVDLPVPCTFDLNIAAAKYFAGLENGEVPLCLQYSGTVFYETSDSVMQVMQIPWDRESKYRLPVSVWQKMIDLHYPNSAWLCLGRDVFDRLYQYKVKHGIPTWDQAVESLLSASAVTELAPDEEFILDKGLEGQIAS